MTNHRTREERITANIGEASRFLRKVVENPSMLDDIPEGARLRVVSRERLRDEDARNSSRQTRRGKVVDAGDQVAYVSDPAPHEQHAGR